MGPFRVYGALYRVLGPLGLWDSLGCMGAFRVYGPFNLSSRTPFHDAGHISFFTPINHHEDGSIPELCSVGNNLQTNVMEMLGSNSGRSVH